MGSLADGRTVAGYLLTASVSVLMPGAAGRQIRGLYRDSRTGLVWAAGNVGAQAHVWAVDGSTGAVVADVVVPGAQFLNDLVVTGRAVWVTDSRVDRLTRIALTRRGRPTGAAPTTTSLTGEWPVYDGTNINANGIRELPDGSLVLNNSRAGGLWQVDPRSGATREIEVRGGPGLVGGDGLDLHGRTLFDVRGSGPAEVSVLELSRRRHTCSTSGAAGRPRCPCSSSRGAGTPGRRGGAGRAPTTRSTCHRRRPWPVATSGPSTPASTWTHRARRPTGSPACPRGNIDQ